MNRTKPIRPAASRGFALMEMLSCLMIVTLSITVSARLFGLILKSYRDTPATIQAMQTRTQWLTVIRNDAWTATAFEARDKSSLTFLVGAKRISWHQEADQLVREMADGSQRWSIAAPLHWSTEDDVLTLAQGDSRVPLATPCVGGQTP